MVSTHFVQSYAWTASLRVSAQLTQLGPHTQTREVEDQMRLRANIDCTNLLASALDLDESCAIELTHHAV